MHKAVTELKSAWKHVSLQQG